MWRYIAIVVAYYDGLVKKLVSVADRFPVALSQTQVDEIKPLATQPVSGSVAVSNFPPAQPGLALAANQLPDGHNVTVSNPTANPETGLAKAAQQLPDGHNVTVSNFPPAQPGLATETTLDAVSTALGAKADDVATSDTGTFSLIALFKRLLAVVARVFVSTKDTGNSTLMTSASGLSFPGAWFDLRSSLFPSMRVIAAQECIVVPLNINEGANGPLTITFNFKFSDDGTNPTVNENRLIDEHGSLSNYSLKNVGSFFRGSLTLSRALVGTEAVVLATDQWYVTPPPFVRLATQSIEEQNAAMPNTFAFLQVFDTLGISRVLRGIQAAQAVTSSMYALLVKSIPVGRNPDGEFTDAPVSGPVTAASSDAQLAPGGFYLSPAINFTMFSHALVIFLSDRALDIEYQLSMNPAATFVQHGTPMLDVYGAESVGTLYRRFVADQAISFKVKITNNSGVATTTFGVRMVMQTDTASSAHTRMDSLISDASLGAMVRGVLSGKVAGGTGYTNILADALGRLQTINGSNFARELNLQLEDNEQIKTDVEPTNTVANYYATCPDGAADSAATHKIIRITLSATRKPTSIRRRFNMTWTGRTVGW